MDRFLNDSYYQPLYGKYFMKEDDLSRKLKSRIAYFRDQCQFEPKDNIEKQIADYAVSSNEWAYIWSENNHWLEVESEMTYYLILLKNKLKIYKI